MFDDTIFKDIDGEGKEVHRVCATKIAMRSANSEAALSAPEDSLQEQPIQNRTAKPPIIDTSFCLVRDDGIELIVPHSSRWRWNSWRIANNCRSFSAIHLLRLLRLLRLLSNH